MIKIEGPYKEECKACTLSNCEKSEMCSLCIAQKLIRGKWKLVIIWLLRDEALRFSELKKAIPNIKQGPLTTQLKELESIGVLNRKSYNQVPPKVEYSLTDIGREFMEIIEAMQSWSKRNLVIHE
ncbi:MAG: winged helix-turn-helix transcriptional regulator [Firmicutes bacterium]|nr:winged helix-turn-helix transcriptional regulator [Bacillota bacterium]